MNEEMEAGLTELSQTDSKTDHLAVNEEANVDEAIPIDLRKEGNTQAYKIHWKLILKRLAHLKRETK